MNAPKTLEELINLLEYNKKNKISDNSKALILYVNEIDDLLNDLKKCLNILQNFSYK